MPINPDLLISAAMLQDYLVDKDSGLPLTNGIVSLYKDTSRSFYKNWYYQTGTPGAYTWIPLDNPLHLSVAGTIQDPNGNDVIPFYYPYQETDENVPEAYYITVYSVDSNGAPAVLQFTRENFPYLPGNITPIANSPTWRNYVLNNVYWRNVGSLSLTSILDQIIAPSQHEGYTNGDIRFIKNVAGANDSISFPAMTATLVNNITPETYLNMQCSSVQSGELVKCIQYPISLHIKTLSNVNATLVFYAQNVAGNVNNYVDVQIYQYLGTGALAQPEPVTKKRVFLNNEFTRYTVPFIFPDASNVVVGNGGDDSLFLRIQFPLSSTFDINHTKPQIYLSDDVPDNDFDTYDQVEAIINSPRTGDYRTSLNSFYPYGFVPANDGSIGSAASAATTRKNIDTWPLYDLLWNGILNTWCPVSGGRGASAYADFSANKTLTLTRNLGRVIAGLDPVFTNTVFTTNYGASNFDLTVASTAGFTTGSPVQFINSGGSLPSAISAGVAYFLIVVSPTVLRVADTIELAYNGSARNIGSNQTGTSTMLNALGALEGESLHTLTTGEVPNLNVSVTVSQETRLGAATNGGNVTAATGSLSGYVLDITGTGTTTNGGGGAHGNIQPTLFANVFIKL